MKKIILTIILIFINFDTIYSNLKSLELGPSLDNHYLLKDLKLNGDNIYFYDYIRLDTVDINSIYNGDIKFGFDYGLNMTSYFKKNIDYAIGFIDSSQEESIIYFIAPITCYDGKIIINSGGFKNFPGNLNNSKNNFYKYFKTCYDLENFFDGNKKYKLSIENNFLDIRYIKIIIVFSIIFLFIIIIFLIKGIIKKLLKKSQ